MTLDEWLGKDNKLGQDIWHNKYQYKNETLDEWFDRVSGGDESVKQVIQNKEFIFGGRILANRGVHKLNNDIKTTYSNCYVLSAPEDNLESIFDCAKKLARTYSYGGGVGIDISKLAPCGAKVRNAAKESSGACSFMDLYSMVTGLISQNGRRGALMISMSCEHPDIEEFIDIKKDLDRVTKANISVRVTDKFMQAVVDDADFELKFERKETGEVISKTIKARDLMEKLAYNNWDMGEPGILFWDRIQNYNMLNTYDDFEYAGTNPCAEEPLPAGGSCLLGSINLSKFVMHDADNIPYFDEKRLSDVVRIAVGALNDVLDEGLKLHPLQEQRDSVRDWRQIGLGIFGLADALIKLGIKYGSQEAIDFCDGVGDLIARIAIDESSRCNEHVFPKFDYTLTKESAFMRVHRVYAKHMHNSQLLTIAPTGTLSTMFGVSGGIEPIFANYYERKTESLHGKDVYYKVYTPIVKEYMESHNIENDADLPDYFVTAKDLDYHDRIKMQAAWQKHIDASISSTVNLPFEATPEDVFDLYIEAWKAGLKGITVFRDGCRRASVLTTEHAEEKQDGSVSPYDLPRGYIIATSDDCIGLKRKIISGCGSLHCTAWFDPWDGSLLEVFLDKGSTGGCERNLQALSRMISLAARGGIEIHAICDQLMSVGGCTSYCVRSATKHDTSKGTSCAGAVANALLDMWREVHEEIYADEDETATIYADGNPVKTVTKAVDKSLWDGVHYCPDCGAELQHIGGCVQCSECPWSKCNG